MLPVQNADPPRNCCGEEQLLLPEVPGAATGLEKEAASETAAEKEREKVKPWPEGNNLGKRMKPGSAPWETICER